ncbi:MAG: MBG domain-containing protein, partial [Tepidisphaeraceae bacterium]
LSGTSPYTAASTYTFAAAGSYNIVATYVPGTDQEFAGSSSGVTVTTVDLIAPTITWAANPQQPIVYGTPLSDVQLTATAADPVTGNTVTGTFVYTPKAGYLLHAGTPNLSVTFLPDSSESTIYSSNSSTESITVTQAPLTVTPDNQTMVYGAAVPPLTYTFSQMAAGDVTSQITGQAQCSITGTPPYTVSGSPYPITCSQGTMVEPDYTFTFATGSTLTVTTATPALTLLCQEVTYDGAAHSCQGEAVGADGKTQVQGTLNISPVSETLAGTYPETGTFTASDGNYVATPQTANATLIIDKATSSVTLTCPSSEPYNGTAWTPCTATATGAGGLSTDVTIDIQYQNNTNPGTASVSVSYTGDANHTGSSNQTTFAISGASVTASAGGGSFTYTGGTFALSGCTISAPTGGYTGGLTCTNSPDPVGPNVTTGPQTVTPVIPGTENTSGFTITYVPNTYTISPATPTVTITCPPAGVVYNGKAQSPCTATVTGPGLNQDITPSITYQNNTNYGTATATVNYAGGGNYGPVSNVQVNFAITAEPVTATAGSLIGAVYTGSSQAIPACAVAATPPNTYTDTLSCTDSPAAETDIGSGTVTPVVSGNTQGNFQVTPVNGSWSIAAATPTVTVSCAATVVYSGGAQTPCTAVVSGPGTPPQTVTWTYTPQNIDVGLVTAKATFAASGDYGASSGQNTFQITPASATMTLNNLNQYFTGSPATPVTANTLPNGLTYSVLYGTTADPTHATSPNPPTATGSYAVLATITSSDYVGSQTGTLAISAAPTTISLTLSGASNPAPYGTNAIFDLSLPIVGGTCPTGTVQWFVDAGPTPVATTTLSGASCSAPPFYQTNTLAVGTHTVSATYSGDLNYLGGSASLSPNYTVALDTTAVVLQASPGTVSVGQGVTFIATITLAVGPGTGNPALAGTVNFLNGANTIGST